MKFLTLFSLSLLSFLSLAASPYASASDQRFDFNCKESGGVAGTLSLTNDILGKTKHTLVLDNETHTLIFTRFLKPEGSRIGLREPAPREGQTAWYASLPADLYLKGANGQVRLVRERNGGQERKLLDCVRK